MKKTLSIIAALCVIISAFSMFSVTASAATDKVSLYSSEVCNRMNGMIGTTVYVQTKDDASNQSVTLHYNQGAAEAGLTRAQSMLQHLKTVQRFGKPSSEATTLSTLSSTKATAK